MHFKYNNTIRWASPTRWASTSCSARISSASARPSARSTKAFATWRPEKSAASSTSSLRSQCAPPPRGITPKGRDGLDVRVTTDGGAPRKPTNPPSISLNDALRSATWPKEIKPTLAEAAHDLAVLQHIANVLGEEVYVLADDYKAFFNQFATHPSEWWKSCFMWLRLSGGEPAPVWIREHVLGFGLSLSSNIVQRFANAMLSVLEQRVDAEEAALCELDTNPVLRAVLAARRTLGPNEARLWSAFVYTDDKFIMAVGAARMARVLGTWGTLTGDVETLMAGESKRQIGNCLQWNGAYFNAFLAQTIIPPSKPRDDQSAHGKRLNDAQVAACIVPAGYWEGISCCFIRSKLPGMLPCLLVQCNLRFKGHWPAG